MTVEQSKSAGSRNRMPFSIPIVVGIVAAVDIFWFLSIGVSVHHSYILGRLMDNQLYLSSIGFVTIFAIFIFHYGGLYEYKALLSPFSSFWQIVISCMTAFLLLMAILFSLKASEELSRVWTFSYAGLVIAAISITRLAVFVFLRTLTKQGVLARNVIIVGGGRQAEKLISQIYAVQPHLYNIIGVFDDRMGRVGSSVADVPVLGRLSDLVAYTRRESVDDIVVTLPWSADDRLISIVSQLRELPANIYIGSDLIGFRFPFRPSPVQFVGIPVMEVVRSPLSGWNIVLKWLEDRILGLLIVIAFAPVMAVVALAIRMESPGPVLFRQKRYGYNNQVFYIYKFRSMYHGDVPEAKTKQATKDDPRITRVGRFIRRTSLDELPQLFNVLQGDMSLVGPRPHAVDHNEEYAAIIEGYFARHNLKPGITGWAQVNGLRGETDTVDKMEARVRFDTYYVENWSLMFDVQILFRTFFVGFVNKNAY